MKGGKGQEKRLFRLPGRLKRSRRNTKAQRPSGRCALIIKFSVLSGALFPQVSLLSQKYALLASSVVELP